MNNGLHVQYGCGFCAPEGWKNYDASPTLRFERVPVLGKVYTKNNTRFPDNVMCGDIVAGLPLRDNSCAGIYASHVLEHLSLEDFRTALKNTYRLLRPNGTFRLVVPDLEVFAARYVESQKETAAEEFIESVGMGARSRERGLRRFLVSWLGNSRHLWMWDEKGLRRQLSNAGFTDVRRCQFGDSKDPMFSIVEDKERYEDAVAMECKK